jgi:hypothetical protein
MPEVYVMKKAIALLFCMSFLMINCGSGGQFCSLEFELNGYKKGDASIKIMKGEQEAARPQTNLFENNLHFQVDCSKYPSPVQVSVVSGNGVQTKDVNCDCGKTLKLSFQEKK